MLLLRRLGIPARYTVGYAVHEESGRNSYVVRQNDAHAWCRVWDGARQSWEDFDTTPASWMGLERHNLPAFQFLFDGWSRLVFEFSKLRWGQTNIRQYILWSLVPVLALLLYQIIFRSGKRRARQDSASTALHIPRPGLDSELYHLERELARRGLARDFSEPLSAWRERIAADPELSKLGQPLRQVVSLHYRYRFDPQGLSADNREELRRKVAACMSSIAVKRRFGFWSLGRA